MTPTTFDYQRAASIKDALAQLHRHGDEAKFLAGGHSLIPAMKLRLNAPTALIDLAGLIELKGIQLKGDSLHVGAMTTHRAVESSDVVRKHCAVLADVAGGIGDPQVRNKGTLGGSIAHADPAADYPALLLALNAKIDVIGRNGARSIDADDFFTGMFDTALDEGELITGVQFPVLSAHSGAAYLKFPNPASRFAVVGVAAYVETDAAGICTTARIGITGAAPMAFRATEMEQALTGQAFNESGIEAATTHTPDEDEMMSDLSGSAAYRKHLCGVMAKRALEAVRIA